MHHSLCKSRYLPKDCCYYVKNFKLKIKHSVFLSFSDTVHLCKWLCGRQNTNLDLYSTSFACSNNPHLPRYFQAKLGLILYSIHGYILNYHSERKGGGTDSPTVGQSDSWTDRQPKNIIPPTHSVCWGIKTQSLIRKPSRIERVLHHYNNLGLLSSASKTYLNTCITIFPQFKTRIHAYKI